MSSNNEFAKLLDFFLVSEMQIFQPEIWYPEHLLGPCVYQAVIQVLLCCQGMKWAENVLSEIADFTGTVKYNLSRLWTEGTTSLQTSLNS